MNFKQAVEEMTKGKKVRRKGWKDVWLIIDNNGNLLCCSPNFYNKEQIDTKIDDLSLTNVENILADDWEIFEEKRKWWEPKAGQLYYYINSLGHVSTRMCYGSSIDDDAIQRGNCFETEERANFMAKKLVIINKLRKIACETNNVEVNWNNSRDTQGKYSIAYNPIDDKIEVCTNIYRGSPFNTYFLSEEVCKKVIEEIGEETLKKYYFNDIDSVIESECVDVCSDEEVEEDDVK